MRLNVKALAFALALVSSVTFFSVISGQALGQKDRGLGQDSPKTETTIWQGESNEPRPGKESTTGRFWRS